MGLGFGFCSRFRVCSRFWLPSGRLALSALPAPFSNRYRTVDVAAASFSCCDRYRGFYARLCFFIFIFLFIDLGCSLTLDFLLHSLPRV
jgi:hypothetical protein